MTAQQIAEHHAQRTERRDAAIRAFWSNHPLNLTFRQSRGETFSLREFIAFVLDLPQEQFDACTRRRA